MLRSLILLCGFLLIVQVSVGAEMIHCRTPDGKQIFTDDPTQVPPDCQPVSEETSRGSMNIIPAAESPPATPAAESSSTSTPTGGPLASEDRTSDPLFARWQTDAELLANAYDEALTERYHEVLAKNQEAAIRKLNEIRASKQKMLEDLSTSALDSTQRDTIRQTLDKIPDE